MVGMACVMVCGVLLLIASDVIRHKAALRLASQLDEERSNVLKKVDDVTSRILTLASQIESKKRGPKESEGEEKTTTLSDLIAVLVERPYTRVSISSGMVGYIAAKTPSGQTVLEKFVSKDFTISEKIEEAVPKGIAEFMLRSAFEGFKGCSFAGGPRREQLPLGGLTP
jgi:hypothetical protein